MENFKAEADQMQNAVERLHHALSLAERGFWIFPLKPNAKTPALIGWQKKATRDPDVITKWFSGGNYNIGLFTGRFKQTQAVFILDVDCKNGKPGFDTLAALQQIHGALPPTLSATTTSGGKHFFFAVNEPVKSGTDALGKGLDVKSARALAVGAGSVVDGKAYSLDNPGVEIAQAPDWLVNLRGRATNDASMGHITLAGIDPARATRRALAYLELAPRSVKFDKGDQCAVGVATMLHDFGCPEAEALDLMLSPAWDQGCGWAVERLAIKVRNAYRYARDPIGSLAPEAVFAAVPLPLMALEPSPILTFKRTPNGEIKAVIGNLLMALQSPTFCGAQIAFDQFKDEIVLAYQPKQWQPFKDGDYVRIQVTLEAKGFKPIGREALRDVARLAAEDNSFDTAKVWLNSLTWDGQPRVKTFLAEFLGAEDSDYTRAVSRYLWTAMAGRVLEPGCKCDMVPVLIGQQGVGKSTAVAALVPDPKFFCEVSFHENEADLARKMRGVLIGEIGELRGLQTREIESIKSFITRTHEKWIGKFKEFASEFPRRLVFIGTTNQAEFLADETGNRRWLPVTVTQADVEGIKVVRNQLWAEAAVMFKGQGVAWREAQALAGEVHENHKVPDDPWTEAVHKWLNAPPVFSDNPAKAPGAGEFIATEDVLHRALHIETAKQDQRMQRRVGAVLRGMGYQRKKVRDGDRVRWAYVPPVTTAPRGTNERVPGQGYGSNAF